MFGEKVNEAAKEHARLACPREACGIVRNGEYIRCDNLAENPKRSFRIKPELLIGAQAIVHSHVGQNGDGPQPSAHDMRGMIKTAIPWGICWTNGKSTYGPIWIGDHNLDEPLIGRKFLHGVYDCYALVRAWRWQTQKIKMPEIPRDNEWWKKRDGKDPEDLIGDSLQAAGAYYIDIQDAKEGDILIMQILSRVPNHCAILETNNIILHHPGPDVGTESRREPLREWERFVRKAVRFAA